MRTKEPKVNYGEISMRSIKRDFLGSGFLNQGKTPKPRRQSNVYRVVGLAETSSYYKYRRYIVGKLVRFVAYGFNGEAYYSFVHDEDRKMLNNEAGWSDMKDRYLFDGIKLD